MALRILVVEDEPAIADTVLYALRTEGFAASWRGTGGEALGALDAESFDLVVLDVGLPDRSGFEVCKEIRKRSAVPVIFLTARADEIDRVVGLEIGGDDYVPKPFSPRELTARVKAVLRRTGAARGNKEAPAKACAAGFPFAIDAKRKRISYFGQALELSRYEYRLLEVLIRRPGWVYARGQLMEMVWEAPESSMERTVDAHVKMLRAKLRAVKPGIEPVVTHRGVGYSLKEDW